MSPFQYKVHNLLANGVVPPGVVIGSVLLARNKLLRMKHLPVGPSPYFINHCRLKINKDSSRNMFSTAGLGEEGLEGVVSEGLVRGHAAVRLDTVLQTVELPTSIANLATGLPDMNGDAENKISI